jgi:hypothetical protein
MPTTESEPTVAELPEYLQEAAPAPGTPSAKTGLLRFARMTGSSSAFGGHRFDSDSSARGTLSREQLLAGASKLLGEWFPEAYADDARRGWGIAFRTAADRAADDPATRRPGWRWPGWAS